MDESVRYRVVFDDQFTSGIKNAQSATSSFESAIGGLKGTLLAAFSIAAVTNFAKSVVEVGSSFEKAEIGLGTLLKSSEKAHQVFEQVKKDAATTPFDVESLLMANKALISAGVNAGDARNDVLNLANAISATGGGNDELQRMVVNMQQIKNTGKATALDIKQFAYAGINIYGALAAATGKTTEQVKGMEVSYETLTGALRKAHEAGGLYEGGLEKMANSTAVQISNLSDAWKFFQNDIFLAIKPALSYVLNLGNEAIAVVKSHFGEIKAIFMGVVEFMRPIFNALYNFVGKIFEGAMKVWKALAQFTEQFKGILGFVQEALVWIIDAIGEWYSWLLNVVAVIIDVAHTIYVILDKLGIIWVLAKVFGVVWEILKAIGKGLAFIYEYTLKPIFDAIEWAYEKLKKILGISDYNVTAKVTEIKKTVNDDGTLNSESNMSIGATLDAAKSAPAKLEVSNTKEKEKEKVITGSKSTVMNIDINKLVENITISTTNLKEMASTIKEEVAKALLEAVNDANLIGNV